MALLLAAFAVPAQGQGVGTPKITVQIKAETISPAPGDTVAVAIIMDPTPGWHDYWLNPGDAGTPLELEWRLPPSVTARPIRAPVPETLIVSGFMNHIYSTKHAFLVDLKLGSDLKLGDPLRIAVKARWSACSDTVCIPESKDLALDLRTGDGRIRQSDQAEFDRLRSAIPVPLDRQALYSIAGNRIAVAVPFPRSASAENVWLFPVTDRLFRYAAPQKARRTGDWLVIEGEVRAQFGSQIDAVLRLNDKQGLRINALPGAVPPGGDKVSVLGATSAIGIDTGTIGFAWILAFSILGGLLLNLMPCVFPILGLKALSIAKMGSDGRFARADALAYSGGTLLSCVALGSLLLVLRAGGEEIGWAFQLQQPVFVLFLLLLMVAVTANLAGLFQIGSIETGDSLTRRTGPAGSFWTGVLAAVVATPCTGPFMAAALGAALLLPTAQALLLFAGLGFGLALPFLAIAFVPAARRMLPRPGPWLGTFRTAMAVPMGLTALALLWLLWRLTGNMGFWIGALAAAIALFGSWMIGRYQRQAASPANWPIATAMALTLLASSFAIAALPSPDRAEPSASDALPAQAFSEARLASYRAERRDIFVYFTADWCLTCKVNEAAAIDREATRSAFADGKVAVLRGDFTRNDPAIARFLASHGRSGVPLYLFYPAGGKPQILPQILTVDNLVKLTK